MIGRPINTGIIHECWDAVAERLREYQAVGVDTVIASGYPHLEEAYRVAELLFPALGVQVGASTIRRGREFDPGSELKAAAG